MNKTTKGALAAAAAGVLLLGGAGTLAYWTDNATVDGASITSGHLTVSGCDTVVWTLEGEPFVPASDKLIPGDELEGTCDLTIDVAGKHFTQVDVSATTPTSAGTAPWDELQVSATVAGSTTGGGKKAVVQGNGNTVPVVITVTWPYGSEDNDLNGDLSTTLDDITVTVQQDHKTGAGHDN